MEKDCTNGMEWRQAIQDDLSDLGICWLDPTCKPTDIAQETVKTKEALFQAREAGNYEAIHKTMKIIRCVDLRMAQWCP